MHYTLQGGDYCVPVLGTCPVVPAYHSRDVCGDSQGNRLYKSSRANGPFISLKNGPFKEPLLSVHFVNTLAMRHHCAVSLLKEREGIVHYEIAHR